VSRSALWALGFGALFVIGLAGLVGHHWAHLQPTHNPWSALVIGLTLYAAATAAVLIRRIVDPVLEIPILVWIAVVAFVILWILAMIFGESTAAGGSYSSSRSSNNGWFSRSKSDPGMGRVGAVFATFLALLGYGLGVAGLVTLARNAAPNAAAASPPEVAPAQARPKTITDMPDLPAAIAFARGDLTDQRDVPSPGAGQLVRYLAARGKFADLAIAKNETSPALVEKDPPSQIGKRLCVTGTLAHITRTRVGSTDVDLGHLATRDGDEVDFYAVGGSGDLVKRSTAKLCGVVTGLLDSSRPATFVVGMLDLPAERGQ
jgi:hypothetical protein